MSLVENEGTCYKVAGWSSTCKGLSLMKVFEQRPASQGPGSLARLKAAGLGKCRLELTRF